MTTIVALVGRPNVGKSTLFNRLTKSRDALVDDQPGVTRDRKYGKGKLGAHPYLVVDTGGLNSEDSQFGKLIHEQVELVLEEAQVVMFLVDVKTGLVAQDREIGEQLRRSGRQIQVLVNKTEGMDLDLVVAEFEELGLDHPIAISARHGDGVKKLIDQIIKPTESVGENASQSDQPVFAIVGRPNVGKSTLTNKLAGEQRVIVSDVAGTTRDSIQILIQEHLFSCTLIDTAGVRRKSRVTETIEKFSIVKTLQTIEQCNVVMLMLDAQTGISMQDATVAGMVRDLGRSIIVVTNKWDGLDPRKRHTIQDEIKFKLNFLHNVEVLFISALHGSGIDKVLPAAFRAYDSAMRSFATSDLNRKLAQAMVSTPPPMHNRRPIRLKFAHQAGKNPPIIVIHGNEGKALPAQYKRYLANYFARAYNLFGTPIWIIPRKSENPFKGKKSNIHRWKKYSGRRRKIR